MISLAAFLCLFVSLSTNASPISIKIEGTVSEVDAIFYPLVSWGDPMTAVFVYDSSLIDWSSEFDIGRYLYYSPLLEYEVSVGDLYAYGTSGRAEFSNNHVDRLGRTWDRFILETGGVSYPSIPSLEDLFDINSLSVAMTLYDFDAHALTTSQPLASIPLESFDLSRSHISIQMEVAGGDFEWQPMFAKITSAEIAASPAIPIPTTAWLFGSALAGLLVIRRRNY